MYLRSLKPIVRSIDKIEYILSWGGLKRYGAAPAGRPEHQESLTYLIRYVIETWAVTVTWPGSMGVGTAASFAAPAAIRLS